MALERGMLHHQSWLVSAGPGFGLARMRMQWGQEVALVSSDWDRPMDAICVGNGEENLTEEEPGEERHTNGSITFECECDQNSCYGHDARTATLHRCGDIVCPLLLLS